MVNAVGDNKNWFVFCFWSLFIAKSIFKGVYMNFMLVGHTYNDIDTIFERWNMSLRKESYPKIPSLMKSFMDVEFVPTIPHFIKEVPNFKGLIAKCIAKEEEALKGHTTVQQFEFFIDSNGCPVMKYRIHCTDNDWLPNCGKKTKKADQFGLVGNLRL
jgi:hypothetical protein